MAGNFKYSFYKLKKKVGKAPAIVLLGISSILLVLLLGWIVYLLITKDIFQSGPELIEQEQTIAEHVVTGTENGVVQLIDVESKEIVDEFKLDSDHVYYAIGNDYEMVYAYDGKEVKSLHLIDGKIKELDTIAEVEVENIDSFKVHEDNVAILSNNQTQLTYVYQEEGSFSTKVIDVENTIDAYHVYEGKLMYSTTDELRIVDANKDELIEIGDQSYFIHNHENNWLVQNQFGSELDSNILVFLNHQDGKIQELEKTESGESQILSFDTNQDVIYTTHYVNATEPYHLLTTWYVENNELKMERDMVVRIPVREDAILYNAETSVASRGYIYTHFNDRLDIFDIRSQKGHSHIPVDAYFAKPVLKN